MTWRRIACSIWLSLAGMAAAHAQAAAAASASTPDAALEITPTLIARGAVIFKARCTVCHGANADGKSDLARIMKPPPANLRASTLSYADRAFIIRKGGGAVGRSPNMPTWELELPSEDILAVAAYVGSISAGGH